LLRTRPQAVSLWQVRLAPERQHDFPGVERQRELCAVEAVGKCNSSRLPGNQFRVDATEERDVLEEEPPWFEAILVERTPEDGPGRAPG